MIDIEKTVDLHGIGPALEAELDAARIGPIVSSILIGFNAYHFLGDLEETVTGTANSGSTAPETATYRIEFDQWAYRAETGIRFRWQPE